MSVMTMMSPLLQGVELTPGQLAELRAIDALYYSHLARDSGAASPSPLALDDLVLSRVRDMLQGEQRAQFDRNRAASHSDEVRDGARSERYR